MPPRSKIETLPEKLREELERRLIASGFGGYRGLADWLSSQGFEISKSALHEWGQSFEDRVNALRVATHQARAIVEATPDDEGAVIEALQRLVSEKLFQAFMALQIDPEKISQQSLGALTRAVADLARSTIAQKKYLNEIRAKGAAVVDEMAKASGMNAEQAAHWRHRFLMGTEPQKGA